MGNTFRRKKRSERNVCFSTMAAKSRFVLQSDARRFEWFVHFPTAQIHAPGEPEEASAGVGSDPIETAVLRVLDIVQMRVARSFSQQEPTHRPLPKTDQLVWPISQSWRTVKYRQRCCVLARRDEANKRGKNASAR